MTKWYLKARDNRTLLITDPSMEKDFEAFTCIKRFNDVGTWALQLRKESTHAAQFMPDSSGGLHAGIIVSVDNEDGLGPQQVFSGQQTDIDVKVNANNTQVVLITGVCDNYSLAIRQALQVPHYPYPYFLTSSAAVFPNPIEPSWYTIATPVNMKRFYTCGDTSGTSALDLGAGVNGTYTGGFTLNQNPLIDDIRNSVLLNGTTGFISVPTTGLNSANNGWWVFGWGQLTSYPGTARAIAGFGTNALKQGAALYVNSSGFPQVIINGSSTITGATAVGLNTPFLLEATWDGTTLTGWLNGVSFGTATPGALSITYGTCNFGADIGASNFWTGKMQMVGFYNGIPTAATHPFLYALGINRQSYLAYDIVNASNQSTALLYFIQRNACASASSSNPLLNYGVAAPATSFTNFAGTHAARAVPGLVLAADPLAGTTFVGLARQDNLLNLVTAQALQGATELGVKVEQSGTTLLCTVYQPADMTATAIFSRDLYGAKPNVTDYEWKYGAAKANHLYSGAANTTGGSSNLTGRLFSEGEDSTSVSQFGLIEDFLDARQAQDLTTLQQNIVQQLATNKAIVNVNATLIDLPGKLYFKGPGIQGYDLGNKVTFIADGQTFQYLIREIRIDLQNDQVALITPAIGTPVNAQIIDQLNTLNDRLQAFNADMSKFKTSY